MHKGVVSIDRGSTVSDAARVMRSNGISSVMIAGDEAEMGIITERDCVTLVAEGVDPTTTSVQDRMSTNLVTVTPGTDVGEAAQLMADHQIRHLPVVEHGRLVGMVSLRDPVGRHPALRKVEEERRQSLQNRVADVITAFAGSMTFVYLHAIWFGAWIALRAEEYPFGLLTMIVSLEAIFLATFVMISQNRADLKRQALADHQWDLVQQEERQNEQLIEMSEQILELTQAIHELTTATRASTDPQ
jgi:predicted transcriptional regulator